MTEVETQDRPWPTELRLKDKGKVLAVTFDNDEAFEFTAEFLRVESPSAEVKGHGPGQEVTVAGKRNVAILSLEPVGNYAAKLFFSDNHSTGLYAWDNLLKMGRNMDDMWQAYLDKMEAEGKSRG